MDFEVDDVQQLLVIKKESPPEQQIWSAGLDHEDQNLPEIKEEQEEADVTEFIFSPVSVKSEDDEERPQCSEFHPNRPEENRHSVKPHQDLESDTEDKTSDLPGICSSDVNQLFVTKQLWSPRLDQGKQKPRDLKQEQEEAEITKSISVPTKSEDDEEKCLSSDLHPSKTEKSRCYGGPELHPDQYLESDFKDKTSDSSETDVSDGNWEESSEPQSGLNSVRNNEDLVGDTRCESTKKICSCTKCGKTFKRKSSLVRHNRIHTGEKPFSCSDCKATFAFKYRLVHHMKMHNRETPFSCTLCKAAFLFKYRLVRHMRVHTRQESYSCTVCGKTFSRKNCLISHMSRHTKPNNCPICGRSFVHRSSLTSHIRLHTGEKPFSCSICQAAFNRKQSLKLHTKTHSGEKPFICPICQATFKWRATFERHTRTHCGKPFSCSVCKAAFRKKMHFMEHTRSHKDVQQLLVSKHEFPPEQEHWSSRLDQEGQKPLQVKEKHKEADITESTISSVYKFKDDEEKLQASKLDLNPTQKDQDSFEQEPDPDQYLEPHPENKYLISPDNYGSDLLRHSRINAGEKPFSCSICKTTFKLRTSLVLHTRTHSGVKPFSCSVCKVAFLTKYTLLQHMRIHTELNMFSLNQKFARVSADKAHQHIGSGKE